MPAPRCAVDPETIAALKASVASHRTLEDVVRWGLAHKPPRVVSEVVVQDEFTHDVVVAVSESLYLVYDTT